MFPVLWDAEEAVVEGNRLMGLIEDEEKLQSYIDNVLRHVVRALRHHQAIGEWLIRKEMVAVGVIVRL